MAQFASARALIVTRSNHRYSGKAIVGPRLLSVHLASPRRHSRLLTAFSLVICIAQTKTLTSLELGLGAAIRNEVCSTMCLLASDPPGNPGQEVRGSLLASALHGRPPEAWQLGANRTEEPQWNFEGPPGRLGEGTGRVQATASSTLYYHWQGPTVARGPSRAGGALCGPGVPVAP